MTKEPTIEIQSIGNGNDSITVNFRIRSGSLYQETQVVLQGDLKCRRDQRISDIEKQARDEVRRRLAELVEGLVQDRV